MKSKLNFQHLFLITALVGALQQWGSSQSIVGMAIAKSDDDVYVWYSNGTASAGSSSDLTSTRAPYNFSLPSGKSAYNIVGMGISANDRVFAWYDDGTVSAGNSSDLNSWRETYRYSLPPGNPQVI